MIGAQLQKAIYDALTTADPSIAGGRIYDGVPENPTYPYITIGEEQVIDDGNSCDDAYEAYATVHVWDRPAARSKAAIKGVVAQVVSALASVSSVTDFVVVLATFESAQTRRDGDGLTEHSILTFRYLLDPA